MNRSKLAVRPIFKNTVGGLCPLVLLRSLAAKTVTEEVRGPDTSLSHSQEPLKIQTTAQLVRNLIGLIVKKGHYTFK